MISLKKELNTIFSDKVLSIFRNTGNFADLSKTNAYLVGGCVRDIFLNSKILDIDIVVETDAIEFTKKLKQHFDLKIVAVQENLKTAKVVFDDGVEIDFSSTRKEKYGSSGSLPELCEFGCPLKEDVLRRDFTINTLAIRLNDNADYILTDYLGGLNDIRNGKLRILHDDSFTDDPSRIFRGLKFALRFNFDFDNHTKTLLNEYLKNKINYSMPFERIKGELKQLFSLPSKEIAIDTILQTGAYHLFTNGVPQKFSQERFDLMVKNGFIPEEKNALLPFVFLIANSSLSFEQLNLSADEIKITEDFRTLETEIAPNINDNCKIFERYNSKSELAAVCHYIATGDATAMKYLSVLKNIKIMLNGNDLISLGFEPSSLFSEIFDKILQKKLNNELLTKEEEIEFAKRFLQK